MLRYCRHLVAEVTSSNNAKVPSTYLNQMDISNPFLLKVTNENGPSGNLVNRSNIKAHTLLINAQSANCHWISYFRLCLFSTAPFNQLKIFLDFDWLGWSRKLKFIC